MGELELHRNLAWGLILMAGLTLPILLVLPAPYGRHRRSRSSPALPAAAGWWIMEAPASLVFAGFYLTGSHALDPTPLFLFLLWQSHYAYRAFIYPLGLRGAGRPILLAIVALGFTFNCFNAFLNATWVADLGAYPDAWLADPRFILGASLFFLGMAVNRAADRSLRLLKRRTGGAYGIPRGGLFDVISCPNYAGEILMWCGWALATWSLAGLAFALFTCANLAPRALAHHRWYRQNFAGYPPRRRALVPWLV